MANVLKWLSGKKTYILAAGTFLLLVVLLALGRLTPELAFEVLVFAAPCFAASYRDALQTHHTQVMDVLLDAVDAGVALRAHNYGAIEGIALKAAPEAESIVAAVSAQVADPPAFVTGVVSPAPSVPSNNAASNVVQQLPTGGA